MRTDIYKLEIDHPESLDRLTEIQVEQAIRIYISKYLDRDEPSYCVNAELESED
jgi:hypothetical protein